VTDGGNIFSGNGDALYRWKENNATRAITAISDNRYNRSKIIRQNPEVENNRKLNRVEGHLVFTIKLTKTNDNYELFFSLLANILADRRFLQNTPFINEPYAHGRGGEKSKTGQNKLSAAEKVGKQTFRLAVQKICARVALNSALDYHSQAGRLRLFFVLVCAFEWRQ